MTVMKAEDEQEIVLEASGWDHVYIAEPEKSKVGCQYAITGNESQVLSVSLGVGETVKGEPGAMMYLSEGMTQHVSCDGCCARCCSGESCWAMNFTNNGGASNIGFVALTPNFPTAKVVPIDLSSPDVNGSLVCQTGSFMASYGDVQVGISMDCNLARCCCAGTGLIRQNLVGSGTVFLAATGTIVQKVLAPGEVIVADTNCILAFAESCKLDIRRAGGIVGMVGGGEGIFNTTLTGPGLVVVQSMNEIVFRQALVANKMYRR